MTKGMKIVGNNWGNELILGDCGMTTEETEDNKIADSTISGAFQCQELATERERERSSGKDKLSTRSGGQEVHISRNCRNCFLCESSHYLKRNCSFKKKTTENCNVIRVFSTNTIKCPKTEIILHRKWCFRLIDSGRSISLLSWSIYHKLGKPWSVQRYTKRVSTANNTAVKIWGRVTPLVQLHPEELVITADDVVESLLGINFLKTKKKCFERALREVI